MKNLFGWTKDVFVKNRKGIKSLPEDHKRYWEQVQKLLNAARSNLGDGQVALSKADAMLRNNPYGYILPSVEKAFPGTGIKYFQKASHKRQLESQNESKAVPRNPPSDRNKNFACLLDILAHASFFESLAKRLNMSDDVLFKRWWLTRPQLSTLCSRAGVTAYSKNDSTMRNILLRDGVRGRGYQLLADKRRDTRRGEKDRHGNKELACYQLVTIGPEFQLTSQTQPS